MTATITRYDSVSKYIADGTIDVDTDTFKVALVASTYTPSASTHTVYADISTDELATGSGYTSGGASLSSVTWTKSGATTTFDAADTVWTASGGSIVARYAVIYKSGTANAIVDPLIAYILLDNTPADVTTTDGNTLTVQWNAAGIFYIS